MIVHLILFLFYRLAQALKRDFFENAKYGRYLVFFFRADAEMLQTKKIIDSWT